MKLNIEFQLIVFLPSLQLNCFGSLSLVGIIYTRDMSPPLFKNANFVSITF